MSEHHERRRRRELVPLEEGDLAGPTTYRDATYSAETQERLRSLLWRLQAENPTMEPQRHAEILALADVVGRWDANEATETTFEETPAEELGRLYRELSELDHETPEHRDTLDRISVLVREAAEARRLARRAQ